MEFGAGASGAEKILEVPLVGAGDLKCDATIRVTVGLVPPNPLTTDRDPRVGLSDGNIVNTFYLRDQGDYDTLPSCDPEGGISNDIMVANAAPVPDEYTLIFKPYDRYAHCKTGQEGGYSNPATFANQLIINKPISLVVFRDDAAETYSFNYFLVEILCTHEYMY